MFFYAVCSIHCDRDTIVLKVLVKEWIERGSPQLYRQNGNAPFAFLLPPKANEQGSFNYTTDAPDVSVQTYICLLLVASWSFAAPSVWSDHPGDHSVNIWMFAFYVNIKSHWHSIDSVGQVFFFFSAGAFKWHISVRPFLHSNTWPFAGREHIQNWLLPCWQSLWRNSLSFALGQGFLPMVTIFPMFTLAAPALLGIHMIFF